MQDLYNPIKNNCNSLQAMSCTDISNKIDRFQAAGSCKIEKYVSKQLCNWVCSFMQNKSASQTANWKLSYKLSF